MLGLPKVDSHYRSLDKRFEPLSVTEMHPSNHTDSKHKFVLIVSPWMQRSHFSSVLTLKVLVATIDAQWEGMGDVGSARYKPALLPPCPTIRVLTLTLPGLSAGVSGSLDSYCSLKPLCSGMGEVVLARTSPTLLPPSPRTVLSLSCFKVLQCINCRD